MFTAMDRDGNGVVDRWGLSLGPSRGQSQGPTAGRSA
jgi:hypothetical protein